MWLVIFLVVEVIPAGRPAPTHHTPQAVEGQHEPCHHDHEPEGDDVRHDVLQVVEALARVHHVCGALVTDGVLHPPRGPRRRALLLVLQRPRHCLQLVSVPEARHRDGVKPGGRVGLARKVNLISSF